MNNDDDRGLPASPGVLKLLFGTTAPVSQRAYAITGFSLMLVKYLGEAAAIWLVQHQVLTFLQFASPLISARQKLLQNAPAGLLVFLGVWTLVFIWIAVSMSFRRAMAAGLSPWLGLTILIPLTNWLTMLGLAATPDRTLAPVRMTPARSTKVSAADYVIAVALGIFSCVPLFSIAVFKMEDYGAVLFLGTPVLCGAVAGFVLARRAAVSTWRTVLVGMFAVFFGLLGMMLFALEGLLCIGMAMPLMLPLGCLGGLIGGVIGRFNPRASAACAMCLVIFPAGTAVEHVTMKPTESVVATEIIVDAPPEIVWKNVVRFPDLPTPTEFLFRAGISCPTGATINGSGVGAERRCIFTTGEFIEPITVWDEPRRLAFDVTSQPEPMFEMTPFRHVHPPHLKDSFVSTRGEFRLEPIGSGQTRLIGRTWYRLRLEPAFYWNGLSEEILHSIHLRVLMHIKTLSEKGRR